MTVAKKVETQESWSATLPQQTADTGEKAAVELSLVESAEGFAELAEGWLVLEAQLDETFSYFQSFNWCYSWWQHIGENADAQLKIFVLRRGHNLVAVWPLQLSSLSFGVKALTPLTYPHSEYSSALFHKDLSEADCKRFVDEVLEQVDCDLVTLAKIPSGTRFQKASAGLGVDAPIEEVASVFEFAEYQNKDDYLASLSTSTRRSRKKRRNKLNKLGEVSYKITQPGEVGYTDLIERALEMKFEWLEHTGRNDEKLKIEGLKQTLAGLASEGANQALVQSLMVDDRPVAIEIGFLQCGHYYAYVGAFDWDMRDYSVGKVQMEQAVLWAIENGVEKYDLLAEPAGYKDSWSNLVVTLQNRTIARSIKGQLYGVVWQHHVRPRVKALFNNLPSDWRTKALNVKKALGRS